MNSEEALENAIGALEDPLAQARELLESLECAETVENINDFKTNCHNALENALALVGLLKTLSTIPDDYED